MIFENYSKSFRWPDAVLNSDATPINPAVLFENIIIMHSLTWLKLRKMDILV